MEQRNVELIRKAISLAQHNIKNGLGGPFGAVIAKDGVEISSGCNGVTTNNDPTAHAEMLAIRRACQQLQTQRLTVCDIYVTLEPCTQCAAAISFARIKRLYFGADDPKGGAVINGVLFYEQATCLHKPDIYSGLQESASRKLLLKFFSEKRTS